MIKGYEGRNGRIVLTHWRFRSLIRCLNEGRDLADRADVGRKANGFAGINWPYSRVSANGYNPYTGKYVTNPKISRKHLQRARASRLRNKLTTG